MWDSDREEDRSSLATKLLFILQFPQILHFLLDCILQLGSCTLLLNVVYFYFFNCHYLWMCNNNLIYVSLNRFNSVELSGRSNKVAAIFPVYCGLFIFIWVVIVPLNLCLFAWFSKASHLPNHTTQVITILNLNLKNRILSYSKDFLMGKMAQIHQISEVI